MRDFSDLPYRPCVGVMLVNGQGHVFVGKRIDNREGDFWQMPQGGIDEGEDLEAAALRELWEETGVTADKLELVARMEEEVLYDLPPHLLGKVFTGKYRGQRQVWMLARFLGEDADVRIDAHDPPEFCEWQWAPVDTLPERIVDFKRAVYEAVVAAFRPLI